MDTIKRSELKKLSKEIYGNSTLENQQLILIKIAVAKAARISYTVVGEEDKPANYENDIKLHDRLAASGHFSPFEHCAKAMGHDEKNENVCSNSFSGNFNGFEQYRKTLPNENITDSINNNMIVHI